MIRHVVTALIFWIACASAFKFEDIPEQYRELVPPEAKLFMTSLSDADKAALKEVFQNQAKYKTPEEIVEALKKASPALGARAENFIATIRKKIAALNPEAQAFAKDMVASARKIRGRYYTGDKPSRAELKQAAMEVINKYKAMSDDGKADFRKQFPILSRILSDEKIIKRLETLN
ncbi:nematode fatty acid retinoid binding protein [Ancylostoma duodenale]|uniref:Fatty-acid and retinol-binding protein 1 n=1 Tax=Ancylostoma duodenale TaxID=51022 RepID=A0A0C2FDS7_9BILA|nr:nematode fatty acid retinoid binding protein [Ancylostoma duodenale]